MESEAVGLWVCGSGLLAPEALYTTLLTSLAPHQLGGIAQAISLEILFKKVSRRGRL